MNDRILFERATEGRHHEVAVGNVAQLFNVAPESVKTLYNIVLLHYQKTARIKTFLSPLVVNRVMDLLRDDSLPTAIEGRRSHRSEI